MHGLAHGKGSPGILNSIAPIFVTRHNSYMEIDTGFGLHRATEKSESDGAKILAFY